MLKTILNFSFTLITVFIFSAQQVEAFEVMHAGALKNFMHRGDISSQFDLSDLKDKKGLYALGALENLEGEIQIFDGAPYNTYTSQGKVVFDKSFTKKASLLVYAQVQEWEETKIPKEITSGGQLENYIKQHALKSGINIEEPFPFLIIGKCQSISWHVINWDKNDNNHTHRKHIESGPHGTVENIEASILGFYSTKHKAIFTHHSTNMHMHFKTSNHNLAGHIDKIVLGKNMVIKFPKKQ